MAYQNQLSPQHLAKAAEERKRIERLLALMQGNVEAVDVFDQYGVWYAPRSLWSMGILDIVPEVEGFDTVQLPMRSSNFRNGSRWPIVVKRISVLGLNYPVVRPSAIDQGAVAGYHNGSAGVENDLRLNIVSPLRQEYAFNPVQVASMCPMPTAQPAVTSPPAFPGAGTPSSLYGVTALRFDKPLILPRHGQMEWDLSSITGMRWNGGPNAPFDMPDADMEATLTYWESRGDMFPGAARSRKLLVLTNSAPDILPFGDYPGINQRVAEGWPYPLPSGYLAPIGGTPRPFWPPESAFNGGDFLQQSSTRDGSTIFYGVNAFIDQIDYDNELLDDDDPDKFFNSTIAQISSRIGTRMRVIDGPDTTNFWQPGAPLASVLDTITPAVVYELPEPLIITPGDQIDITVEVTGPAITGNFLPRYIFAVSLNGFCAIEA